MVHNRSLVFSVSLLNPFFIWKEKTKHNSDPVCWRCSALRSLFPHFLTFCRASISSKRQSVWFSARMTWDRPLGTCHWSRHFLCSLGTMLHEFSNQTALHLADVNASDIICTGVGCLTTEQALWCLLWVVATNLDGHFRLFLCGSDCPENLDA